MIETEGVFYLLRGIPNDPTFWDWIESASRDHLIMIADDLSQAEHLCRQQAAKLVGVSL